MTAKPRDYVRVSSQGDIAGPQTQVMLHHFEEDPMRPGVWHGTEIDISRMVHVVDIHLKVGEPTKCVMEMFFHRSETESTIEKLALKFVYPGRIGRLRFGLRRRWHGQSKLIDVTALGHGSKRYLPGLRERS